MSFACTLALLLGAVGAQEPTDFRTGYESALDACFAGDWEAAVQRFERCLALEPPAVNEAQIALAAARIVPPLERLGRREEALRWAHRCAEGANERFLHWFEHVESLSGLRRDARFTRTRELLEEARERTLTEQLERARERQAELETLRERRRGSVILWEDGHTGHIERFSFSPDGERLVSAARDRTVRLWSTRYDGLRVVLDLFGATGVYVSFSWDGDTILVVDLWSSTAAVFDGASGRRIRELRTKEGYIRDAAFGPDGAVFVLTLRGQLQRFDVLTGEASDPIELEVPGRFLQVDRDSGRAVWDEGSALVLGTDDRFRLCDVREGTTTRRFSIPFGSSFLSGRLGDGRFHVRGEDGKHYIFADGDEEPATVIDGPRAYTMAMPSSDGSLMLSRDPDYSVIVSDTRTGERLRTLVAGDRRPLFVATGPGDRAAVIIGDSSQESTSGQTVWFFDLRAGQRIGVLRVVQTINRFLAAFSPDGRFMVARGPLLGLVDAEGGGRLLASHAATMNGIAVGDGEAATGLYSYAFVESPRGPWSPEFPEAFPAAVRRFDLTTGATTEAIGRILDATPCFDASGETLGIATPYDAMLVRGDERLHLSWRLGRNLRFSPDGQRFALTKAFNGGSILLADVTGEILGDVTDLGWPFEESSLCPAIFSPGGEMLVTPFANGDVLVSDGFDATPFERLVGHRLPVSSMAFDASDPSGSTLATSSADGTARIWSLDWFESTVELVGHDGPVTGCAFSPDGRWLATSGSDGTVRVWDAKSGDPWAVLEGHGRSVAWVGFDPRRGTLLSVGADGTGRLWDVEAKRQVAQLDGHRSEIPEAQFTGDGRILTRGLDSTVRVWDGESGRLLATRVEYDEGGWLCFEPGGRYIAGGRAEEWARVQVRGRTYPLSCYAAVLDDPDAVRRSLAGEILREVGELHDAPRIRTGARATETIDRRRLQATVLVESDSQLESVIVERDGEVWASGLDQPGLELEPGGRFGTLRLDVPFVEGASEIAVRIRARSRLRIESPPLELFRSYEPPPAVVGDLYLITISIADYDEDRLDLAAPHRDAEALAERMLREQGGLFDEVHRRSLVDAEVEREALDDLLVELVSDVDEDDTILVFVAGHGARDRLDRYFLLTPGATPERPTRGIRYESLEDLVTYEDLAARRRVLLIDSCYAGSGGDGRSSSRGIDSARAYSQGRVDDLAGSGIYVVAGSTRHGKARETRTNGVFTAAILRGLEGSADDDGDRDGTVDIAELIEFARQAVLEEDGPQRVTTPMVEGGDAFPLARTGKR